MKIYFLSTVHVREDVRVYHNEFKTILEKYPSSSFVVADGKGSDLDKGIIDLGIISRSRVLRPVLGAAKVFLFFRNKEKSIIHFHDPEILLVAPLLRLLGHKLFYDVHEDLPRQIFSKHWIPKFLMKPVSFCVEAIEKCSSLFINHYFTATPQISSRFKNDKTTIIRNYPSKSIVDFRALDNEVKHIAYLGNITHARGIYEMLSLIEELNNKGIKLRLKLGGRFAPNELKNEVTQHSGWKYVDFVGWVNRADINDFFQGVLCGLVILKPYPNYLESSPNKLFEYMAMGLPVIASDFPVWKELIDDSDGVFFVPHDDVSSMVSSIISLQDESLVSSIRNKCKKAILEKYNWENEAEKMLEVYARFTEC